MQELIHHIFIFPMSSSRNPCYDLYYMMLYLVDIYLGINSVSGLHHFIVRIKFLLHVL